MLLLLPPSETKRDGGEGGRLDYAALSHPVLTPKRRELVSALERLAADPGAMMRALKLGPKQAAEVDRNRSLASSPTMPAIDRYTGVLYDGLDAKSLPAAARARAGECVRIQSALFGILGGLDPVPAYRLSHDSRVPGHPLKSHWAAAVAVELAAADGLVLDLRSEGYAALGPLPDREEARYLRVLTRGADGTVRALNHFNKKAKGEFTRAMLLASDLPDGADALLAWAREEGFELRAGSGRELELIV